MNKELEKHLGHRFRVIHNRMDRYFTKCWENEEQKLTRAQSATLHYLYDHRHVDVFQKDIEEFFFISGATASNTLKGLERQKMIERIPLKEDARSKRIVLTEKGVELHKKAFSEIMKMEQVLVTGMSEEQQKELRFLLDRVIKNLESMQDQNHTNS